MRKTAESVGVTAALVPGVSCSLELSLTEDCGESNKDKLEADFSRDIGCLKAELSILGMKTPMKVLVVYGAFRRSESCRSTAGHSSSTFCKELRGSGGIDGADLVMVPTDLARLPGADGSQI